jgi:hypothetical protein
MDRITRFSGVFPILFFLIASTLLAWFSLDTYQRFSRHQINLAKQSTKNAAGNISHNIKVLRREIALFAAQKEKLIKRVAKNPNDEKLFNQLSEQLIAYFPNYYAFTVADTKGVPQLKFSQAKISTSCRLDLANFSQNITAPNLYVHQFIKPEILHFDLMTRINIKGESVPFFVSFHMNLLARVLGGSSIAGHQLLLLEKNPNNPKVKAFSIYNENGETWLKLDSNTPTDENDFLAQTNIRGSNWLVVDIPNNDLYSTELTALITKAIAMTVLFFLV